MDPIIIAVLAVLCQYPVAVLSLIKLFKLKTSKNAMLVWNFIIILLPFLGAGIFWIYYAVSAKKRAAKIAEDAPSVPDGNKTDTEENGN